MTITAQVDEDIKCIRKYFQKLFELLQKAIEEDKNTPIVAYDAGTFESQATYFRISHLIKPDMVTNIYGFIDFWLKKICEYQKKRNNLSLDYDDFKKNTYKKKSDLYVYQKYLIEVIGLDLTSVSDSYKHLDNLRIVRNKLIHSGGHVLDENEQEKIANIDGIGLGGTLIFIDDSFIWRSLDHAKKYLFEASKI